MLSARRRSGKAGAGLAVAVVFGAAVSGCAPRVESDSASGGQAPNAAPSGAAFVRTFPPVAPRALSVAQDGGIILAGIGSSDVFDGGSSDPNAAALPVWFVAAFDSEGRLRWSRRMASRHAKVDAGHALGADCIALPGGRAACAGHFSATLELADGELICEGANTCAFVATLDEHGDVNWSTTAPSPTALCENWTATISNPRRRGTPRGGSHGCRPERRLERLLPAHARSVRR